MTRPACECIGEAIAMPHNWTALAIIGIGGAVFFFVIYAFAVRELHYREYMRRKRNKEQP